MDPDLGPNGGLDRVARQRRRSWVMVHDKSITQSKTSKPNAAIPRFVANSPGSGDMKRVFIATSNPGKLRDFAGAAGAFGIEIAAIPNFSALPAVIEDGKTFEANARKKAEFYSRHVPDAIVLADDSGLEVDALDGAPGVHSARYAAELPHAANSNTEDEANNRRLLRELKSFPPEKRAAQFVCVIAAARNGETLAVFRGHAKGMILDAPRGHNGFGYDPLFYFPPIHKTFAELEPEEKGQYSHRGAAFREFLSWYSTVSGL